MPVIARKERPHPGAHLRLTDTGGLRVPAFATNSTREQHLDLGYGTAAMPAPRTASGSARTLD